ncbi:hypothetical protein KKG61_09295 [bacterium]|nr:hypothetical protein [bacterium]MBU1600278.1 hypothetical protein [bacterium]
MEYEQKPSFIESLKTLPQDRKEKVKEAIKKLVIFFETGEKSQGLGLKKIRKNFWEIRTNIKDRILFRVKNGVVEFIIVGKHDDIRRCLKLL